MCSNTVSTASVPDVDRSRGPEPCGASAEELLAELRCLEEGSAAADRLRERVVDHYRSLLHSIARRYGGRGEEFEDLRQTAYLGLLKAMRRFDPDRGRPFISYLIPTVTGEIKRHFRDHTWAVHTPRTAQSRRPLLRQTKQELEQRLCRQPSKQEIARSMGLTVEDVEEVLLASEAYNTLSLNEPAPRGDDSPNPWERYLGVRDPGLDLVVDRQAARSALIRLTPREKLILRRRYFDGWEQKRIAREVGCSQMHVSRLLSGTLEWLRAELS